MSSTFDKSALFAGLGNDRTYAAGLGGLFLDGFTSAQSLSSYSMDSLLLLRYATVSMTEAVSYSARVHLVDPVKCLPCDQSVVL